MKPFVLLGRLASTIAAVACVAATPAYAQDQSKAPATLALLVGIDTYAKPANGKAPSTLKGATNDVRRAKKLLIDQFGFEASGIKTLIGPQATHKAIVTTFHDHLIKRAGPDTRVVFWFSGHGSRVTWNSA